MGIQFFSPDGSKIAFDVGRLGKIECWISPMDPEGNKKILVEEGGCPCWSPDGSYFVFTGWTDKPYNPHENVVLYIIKADGSGKRQLTFGPEP
ncbi:MAG: hypothetical protein ABIL70_05275 [candidate division WOR-3 bacterium]